LPRLDESHHSVVSAHFLRFGWVVLNEFDRNVIPRSGVSDLRNQKYFETVVLVGQNVRRKRRMKFLDNFLTDCKCCLKAPRIAAC
jgi:hypothetical protein